MFSTHALPLNCCLKNLVNDQRVSPMLFSLSKQGDMTSSQVQLRRIDGVVVEVMVSKLRSYMENKNNQRSEELLANYTLMLKLAQDLSFVIFRVRTTQKNFT